LSVSSKNWKPFLRISIVIPVMMAVLVMSSCSHMRRVSYPPVSFPQTGTASWYGEDFHGKPTASGVPYDMYGLSAAHNTLPLGTTVRVTHLGNGRSVELAINDRGPFVDDRIIDLSYGAAKVLDMDKEGLAKVRIEVVQTPRAINERYTVQAGAFAEKPNAVALVERLRKSGYDASIEEAFAHGRHIFRVRIGTYSTLNAAQDMAESLSSRGIKGMVIGL